MGFLRKLFGIKERDARVVMEGTFCGFEVAFKGNDAQSLKYGPCDVYRILNISSSGLALRHNNSLKKGDMLEFHTKYCIKDSNCFSCPHFSEVEEKLFVAPFIGKVVWRNDFVAGFAIIKLAEKDKIYLKKMFRSGEAS